MLRHHAPCLCMKFHACSTYTTLKLGGGVQAASLSGQTSNVHQGPTRLDKKSPHTHTCLRMYLRAPVDVAYASMDEQAGVNSVL